uniref:Aminotransferase-like plant mobile domain-containing protein n=1 Tax=Fagus sylvatica TaxID=28930 RepID=A0A2N9EGL6_FAGSY
MASSSSTTPISPAPHPSTGERSETPVAVLAASVVDAPEASPSVPSEATGVAPSFVSGETNDPWESFVFPLVDPWYESSPLFPPSSVDFSFSVEDWDWTEAGVHWSILISRSCGMFRDTEPLREVLRRWCPSTHTFFFSWGELTVTLEDIANHWILPVLGEHSFSNIKLSMEEEEIAAALRRQSSTRLSGWSSLFIHRKEVPVCRAAFILYWLYFRDNLPLVYHWVGLKTRDYDLVDALDHEENVLFRPYGDDYPGFACISIFSRFYQPTSLILDLRVDDYRSLAYLSTETITSTPNLSPFIKSSAFAHWQGESMVEYVNVGRGDKAPISVHRKPQTSNPCLAPPSQSAISYANSQKLGFAEWDEVRGGWIAYTIHLPECWRNSVNIVEDRLIMPSKRGKGSKRDAPVDLVVEKASKKPALSPKKTSPKKTKAGKKGKSTTSVLVSRNKSTTALVETPIESTATPSKAKSVGASLSKKKSSKKSVASRPPKGQRKASTSSSSLDEEQPSAALTHSPPKKKKLVVPPPHSGAVSHTRRTRKSGRSDDTVVDVEDSDTIADDVPTSPSGGSDPLIVVVDQDKDLGKSMADGFETDVGPTEGGHSASSDSFFNVTPGSMLDEQMVSAGSAADADDMLEADNLNVGSADLMSHNLAIVPHASHSFGHGCDNGDAADSDAIPLSLSVPQTVLTSIVTGFDASMAFIMEGISLFGATPRLSAIPAGGFVISANRITGSESVVDLGVILGTNSNVGSAVDHGAQAEGTSVSAADMLIGSEYLDNIGSMGHSPTTKHGDFITKFKLGAGLGGPMLSLLSSVLADMSKSDLGSVTKVQILAWSSVVQDLMEVGFDISFMLGHLLQIAQHLFGRKISDEIQALQHQIAFLQDSLAVLTTYHEEMVSTGVTVPEFERSRSLFDSLIR